MFDNRAAEDLRLQGGREGLWDAFFARVWESRRARALGDAARSGLARLLARPAMVAVNLGPGKTAVIEAGGRCRIDAITGQLWITARGVYQDYALGEGGRLELAGPGKVVVTSMDADARVELRWG